jgi:glutathione S-transferase
MRLYHTPISSNARRVTMTAKHLGLEFDETIIDLASPEDRRRLLEINPNCKVPVLQDGDMVLWESGAIMQYLADLVPGQTLFPQELKARADVSRWMFFACQHFSPAIGVLTWENVWKKFVKGTDPDPAEVARGTQEFDECASVLNDHLANRQWVSGNTVTLADYALAASLMYIAKARLPVEKYTHMLAWFARVQQLPAWQQTEAVW